VQLSKSYVQNVEEHYIDAQNVQTQGRVLSLITKEAGAAGLAWDEKLGFIPRHFNYTAGLVNTAGHYQTTPTSGKIEIKLRISAVKNLYHACWLNSEKKTPAVSLFNFCNNKLEVGIYHEEHDDKICRKARLSAKRFYVVQLEWDEEHITWLINGKKIAQKPNTIDIPLYLNMTSGMVGKVRAGKLPAYFEIDRVRIFERE
jgi:beta-glucanase (GH16 family)